MLTEARPINSLHTSTETDNSRGARLTSSLRDTNSAELSKHQPFPREFWLIVLVQKKYIRLLILGNFHLWVLDQRGDPLEFLKKKFFFSNRFGVFFLPAQRKFFLQARALFFLRLGSFFITPLPRIDPAKKIWAFFGQLFFLKKKCFFN